MQTFKFDTIYQFPIHFNLDFDSGAFEVIPQVNSVVELKSKMGIPIAEGVNLDVLLTEMRGLNSHNNTPWYKVFQKVIAYFEENSPEYEYFSTVMARMIMKRKCHIYWPHLFMYAYNLPNGDLYKRPTGVPCPIAEVAYTFYTGGFVEGGVNPKLSKLMNEVKIPWFECEVDFDKMFIKTGIPKGIVVYLEKVLNGEVHEDVEAEYQEGLKNFEV